MGSMEEAIREDPDRFLVDMDLRRIIDKQTFDEEVEKAKMRCTRSYTRQCTNWTKASDTLYDTASIQSIKIENIERGTVKLKKRHGITGDFVMIRGYDMGDGTFLMTKTKKGITGKTFKMVVRRKHK